MAQIKKYSLSAGVFLFVFLILGVIQINLETNMLILERFITGGGWLEIVLVGFYGSFLFNKMKDPGKVAYWRRISWSIFSVVFFSQFILGIAGLDKFLMTGELHLPIPAMIISGPIYRGELSVMTFLFLSTIILTGPAWCSHLCYFGGLDNTAAKRKSSKMPWHNKFQVKHTFLLLIVTGTILLRIFSIAQFYALLGGLLIGITGVALILIVTARKGKMANCTLFCPVGTVVMYLKFVNPFRMYLDSNCTGCGVCTLSCKYDALTPDDIKKGRPGMTCTYCGDCLSACHASSIKYKFFGLNSNQSRNLYLFLTVSVHVVFLALARI